MENFEEIHRKFRKSLEVGNFEDINNFLENWVMKFQEKKIRKYSIKNIKIIEKLKDFGEILKNFTEVRYL